MTNIYKTLVGVLSATLMGLIAAPVHSAEVTLKTASCFPIGSPPSRPFEAVVAEVNERGKGIVQFDMVGGAPKIGSPFTLTQKMSKGVYDVVGCTEVYFGNVIEEAPAFRLSEKSFAELRKNGVIDYLQKLLNEKGIHYVARYWDFGTFHLWLNEQNKITKPDLTGLHLRVAPVYTAFFKSLGATVQQATLPQIYTYMENNTVQGFGWPAAGWVPPWAKVTKYRVDPGFYLAPLHLLVNLEAWNKLTQEQQDFITKIGLEHEAKSEPGNPTLTALRKKEDDFRASKGMEVITFSGADREKWLNAAYTAGWGELLERSPEHGAKLKALVGN